ncbi:PspC domain-containing protein [Candidatus Bipolaricaulota bacterium]
MTKQLKRSTSDSMLGGVCGGLGAYFSVDANLIRLLFVILAVVPGFGVPVYLILWLILPEASKTEDSSIGERVREVTDEIVERAKQAGQDVRSGSITSHPQATILIGVALVVVGLAFLFRNLGFSWMRWIAFGTLWPALIILVGVAFLWRWIRGGD